MAAYWLLPVLIGRVLGQINLGSFMLRPAGPNGFDLGLGQSANVFGFGGDRGFRMASRPQGLGMQTSGGALVGGERVGVDSGFGVERSGLGLGSQLQFGNNPMPMHPGGQLGQFVDNIKSFFSSILGGPPRMMRPPPPPVMPPPKMRRPRPEPTRTAPISLPPMPTLMPNSEDYNEDKNSNSDFDHEGAVDGEVSGPPPRASRWNSGEASSQPQTSFNQDGGPNTEGSSKFNFQSAGINSQEVDPLFKMSTEKPRQLPGLIEFRRRH